MERNFYTDEFEQYLREKTDDYKLFPSDNVWKKIHRQLHTYRRWTMFGISALLLGATFLGGRFFLNGSAQIMADAANKQIAPSNGNDNIAERRALPPNQLIIAVNNIRERKLSNLLFQDIAEKNDPSLQVAWLKPAVVDSPALVTAELPAEKEIPATIVSELVQIKHPSVPSNVPPAQEENKAVVAAIPIARPRTLAELNQETATTLVPEDATPSISSLSVEDFLSEEDRKHIEAFALNYLPPERKKLSFQFYVTPTVSYRRLTDWNKNINLNSTPTYLPNQAHTNLDQYVNHKPAIGFEAGSNMLVKLLPGLTLKTGLQFNFSRFQVNAYHSIPEVAAIAMSTGARPDTMFAQSSYRNFSGYSKAGIQNQYMQLSMPIGLELRIAGTNKFSFNIAGALQPTYLLNSSSYLLSSNYKHYAKAPDDLVRKWNLHSNLEAYFAFEKKGLRWQLGPQFRYQMLSTYHNKYPIREYIMDYGFKVGVSKIFK